MMARNHLLEQHSVDMNKLITHRRPPLGRNEAGVLWTDVLEYAHINKRTELRDSTKIVSVVNVLDEDGDPIPVLDEDQDPILDDGGNPVYQTTDQVDEVVGLGQISDAEKARIVAGEIIEVSGTVKLDGDSRPSSIIILSRRMYDDWETRFFEKYQHCGQTQG